MVASGPIVQFSAWAAAQAPIGLSASPEVTGRLSAGLGLGLGRWELALQGYSELPIDRSSSPGRVSAQANGGQALARLSLHAPTLSGLDLGLGASLVSLSIRSQGYGDYVNTQRWDGAGVAEMGWFQPFGPHFFAWLGLGIELRSHDERLIFTDGVTALNLPALWLVPELAMGWRFL
jgi:hypothetical protein